MHRTGTVPVKRLGLGVRSVATAPKPNLSKWALPESSADAPRATSWSRPLGAGNASADLNRSTAWSRPLGTGDASASATRSTSWSRSPGNEKASVTRRVNPSDAYMSKWARPSALPEQPRPQTRGPDLQREGFQRQAAPHTGLQQQRELPQWRENNRPARWEPRIDPLATRRGYDNKAAAHTAEKQGRSAAPRTEAKVAARTNELEDDMEEESLSQEDPLSVEDPQESFEEVFSDTSDTQHTRHKMTRQGFKERGSIVSRISQEGSAPMIPSHSRVKTNQMQLRKAHEKKSRPRVKRPALNIFIPSVLSVGNFAKLLKIRLDRLQRKMVEVGMADQSSYDHLLNAEYASLLAMEFNRNPIVNDEAAFDIYPPAPSTDYTSLPSRPPVVTIMGHVDHGKTTLLDTLRSAAVAKGEAGGITQHIGAFSVPVPASSSDPKTERSITFLDTPGHAAFSAMRARGARVTDIVVLVVAADDGIMPQTREVINLVTKEAGKVGLVVAINKIDKPGADVRKVETALLVEGIQLESFGGDVPCVHVSGLTGQGLPKLVETISAVAEIQDVRAETSDPVQGYVLESKVSKGLGVVATVLVLRGELKAGTNLIAGTAHAKVRRLTAPSGASVKSVKPGTAAVVSGWKELPKAGDEVLSGSDRDVKRALENRLRKATDEALLEDAETLNQNRREERDRKEAEENIQAGAEPLPEAEPVKEKKELRIVLKGDVSGSVEAVEGALQGIGNAIAGVKIISTGVGDVTESDVAMAKAVDGIVVAFSVNIPRPIESIANGLGVPSLKSDIIYQLMDLVKKRVIDLLPPIIEKKVTGEADVLQIFEISLKAKKTMKVAGCRVINGIMEKNKMARVVRKGEPIYEGKLKTLRHLKKEITEAGKGVECGMAFADWDDLQEGDLVQSYTQVSSPGSL